MNAALRAAGVLTVVALGACTLPRPATRGPAPAATALNPTQLLAAVQSDADRIDQSNDAAARASLLAAATLSARQCLGQYPDQAACHYAQGQVLGLTARERPLQASSLLKDMLASLTKAEALDPGLDHAGPARLTAVVYMRAPPWPLGPGDVDAATAAAQRAAKRDAAYPPNLITLAQAQAKRDGAPAARATYALAQKAVLAWAVSADRAQWQRDIDQQVQALQ